MSAGDAGTSGDGGTPPSGGSPNAGGASAGDAGAMGATPTEDAGCGCRTTTPSKHELGLIWLALLAAMLRRRSKH
jgi:hypothetical protein